MKSYQEKLQETKQSYLEEGLWDRFLKWMEAPQTKHPIYRRFMSDFNGGARRCHKAHPPLKDVNFDIGAILGDTSGRFSYRDYEENPKYTTCFYTERVRVLKELMAWMKKAGPKEVCKYNRHTEKCEAWYELDMFDNIRLLKEAESIVNQMKRGKISRSVYSKLQKNIG